MEIQLPESERRWLHAFLVLGTLVLAMLLIAQVSVVIVFFYDILLILLLAWLLAFMLSPLVKLIDHAFPKLPRVVTVAAIYVLLFVALSAIILVVAGSLAGSIGDFVGDLPNLQAQLPQTLAGLQSALAGLGFQVDLVKAAQDLLGSLGNVGDKLVGPLTDLAIFSLGIVGNLLIVIFLSLFIVLDQERMLAWANRLIPPRYADAARLFETSVSTSFGGFIRGQAIQGLVMAGVVTLAHLLFGLPFLPASAALSGILQLIPFFGPIFSWLPPVVIAGLAKPDVFLPTLGVVIVGWFLLGNVLVPRIMSKAVGIHPVVVLVAVLIGVKLAGFAGAIFALPVAAIIASFVQHYLARNAQVPRDVTTRAAQVVAEREGRVVRVPKAPPANTTTEPVEPSLEPTAAALPTTAPVVDATAKPARKRTRRSAEPAQ